MYTDKMRYSAPGFFTVSDSILVVGWVSCEEMVINL